MMGAAAGNGHDRRAPSVLLVVVSSRSRKGEHIMNIPVERSSLYHLYNIYTHIRRYDVC